MEGPDGPQPARFQVPAGVEDPTAVIEQTSAPMRSLSWSLPDGTQELRLDDREIVIGRGPEVTLPLSDPLVSRRHARIYLESGRARLQDVGSANGTFLNGERIAGEALLHAEDVIRLGSAELTFHEVGSPTPPLATGRCDSDGSN
jgi:pSer/pThr/pTyr-binding forkhead associated (FHA) protein